MSHRIWVSFPILDDLHLITEPLIVVFASIYRSARSPKTRRQFHCSVEFQRLDRLQTSCGLRRWVGSLMMLLIIFSRFMRRCHDQPNNVQQQQTRLRARQQQHTQRLFQPTRRTALSSYECQPPPSVNNASQQSKATVPNKSTHSFMRLHTHISPQALPHLPPRINTVRFRARGKRRTIKRGTVSAANCQRSLTV